MSRDPAGPGRGGVKAVALVIAASLAVNAAALAWLGVRPGGDTARYLDGADNMIAGRPFREKQASYLGYVAVVALCRLAGVGLAGVVALQVAAAALAAAAQYDLGRRLGGPVAGAFAAGLLVANPDIARWHAFVLTDSPYTSLVVLSTWTIDRAAARRGARWYLAASALVLAAAAARPNGWVLLPIAGASWVARAPWPRPARWLAAATIAGAGPLAACVVPALRAGIQAEAPDQMLYRGEVIWGYAPARVRMPRPPAAAAGGWPSAVGYVASHPAACAGLAWSRVLAELGHARPFYSAPHNAALAVALPPLYALAAAGLFLARREPLARLLAAVVAGHLLVVALTFADWDGRFLLYAMPAILALAGRAAAAPRARAGPAAGAPASGEQGN